MPKIGNTLLKSIQLRDKPYEIHDDTLKGFLVRVQPTGQLTYYVRYRVNGRETRKRIGTPSTHSPAQARDDARAVILAVLRGQDPTEAKRKTRRDAMSLEVWLTEFYGPWITQKCKRGADQVKVLRSAFKELLEEELADITRADVDRWYARRLATGRVISANRYVGYLRAALNQAKRWKHIENNPLDDYALRKEDNSRVRYLSADEEERLYYALDSREERIRTQRDNHNKWCRERGYPERPSLRDMPFADYLKPMVLLLLNTGMRRGELFSLEWADVDFEARRIRIRAETAKSGKTRHIPTNGTVFNVLTAWRTQVRGENLVFPNPDTGKRFDNISKGWNALLKEAKIENFKLHDCRHHFASALVMRGIDLLVVRELLGHSSMAMTLRDSAPN